MPPTPLALLRATVRLFVGSEGSQPLPTRWWIAPFIVVLMAVAFVLSSIAAGEEFPVDIGRAVGLFIDEIVDWLTENVSWFFQAIKDVLTWFLVALEDALFWMPWPAFIVTVTLTAWLLVSFRMAIFSVAALLLVGAFGLWESTMETVALIVRHCGAVRSWSPCRWAFGRRRTTGSTPWYARSSTRCRRCRASSTSCPRSRSSASATSRRSSPP